jgi:hypothetical protein
MVNSDARNYTNEAKNQERMSETTSQEKMSKPKSVHARLPLGRQGDPSIPDSIVRAIWDTPSTAAALVGGVLSVGASVLTCSATAITVAATVVSTGLTVSATGLSVVASGFILVSEATVPMHTAHFTAGQQAITAEYEEEDEDFVFVFHPEPRLKHPYDADDMD